MRLASLLSRYRRILLDGFWAGFGLGVSGIAALIGTRLITEFAPPEVFGPFNLLYGMALLVESVFCRPVLQAQLRFYADVSLAWRLRRAATRLLRRSFLPIVALMLAGGALWGYLSDIGWSAFVWLAVVPVVSASRTLEFNFLGIARRQKALGVLQSGEAVVRPPLIILAIVLLGTLVSSLVLGHLLSVAAAWLAIVLLVRREGTRAAEAWGPADDALTRDLLFYARPLIPLALVLWVVGLGDRYIIGAILGAEQVGIYVAAYGLISQPFLLVQNLLARTLMPLYFKARSSGDRSLERRTFLTWLGFATLLSISGFLSLLVLRHWIVATFLAERYRESVTLIPWIAGGYGLATLAAVFEMRLYARKQTGRILVGNTIVAIAALLAPFLLIGRYGLIGVAMACPIYFALMLLMMLALSLGRPTCR